MDIQVYDKEMNCSFDQMSVRILDAWEARAEPQVALQLGLPPLRAIPARLTLPPKSPHRKLEDHVQRRANDSFH